MAVCTGACGVTLAWLFCCCCCCCAVDAIVGCVGVTVGLLVVDVDDGVEDVPGFWLSILLIISSIDKSFGFFGTCGWFTVFEFVVGLVFVLKLVLKLAFVLVLVNWLVCWLKALAGVLTLGATLLLFL